MTTPDKELKPDFCSRCLKRRYSCAECRKPVIDCRTCERYEHADDMGPEMCCLSIIDAICINGSEHKPTQPIRLYEEVKDNE